MEQLEPAYLGDGVYIEPTSSGAVLYTSDGVTKTNLVYLEYEVILSLLNYLELMIRGRSPT